MSAHVPDERRRVNTGPGEVPPAKGGHLLMRSPDSERALRARPFLLPACGLCGREEDSPMWENQIWSGGLRLRRRRRPFSPAFYDPLSLSLSFPGRERGLYGLVRRLRRAKREGDSPPPSFFVRLRRRDCPPAARWTRPPSRTTAFPRIVPRPPVSVSRGMPIRIVEMPPPPAPTEIASRRSSSSPPPFTASHDDDAGEVALINSPLEKGGKKEVKPQLAKGLLLLPRAQFGVGRLSTWLEDIL